MDELEKLLNDHLVKEITYRNYDAAMGVVKLKQQLKELQK